MFQVRTADSPNENNLSDLKDKVVVIFGGTSGIGESISLLAEKFGANVFVSSDKTGVDVMSYSDVEKFLKGVNEKAGKIDYVINTAGVLKIGKLTDRDVEDIKQEINVNYVGSINVAKARPIRAS